MPERIPTFEESIMPRSTIKACARTVLHADTAIKKEALTALAKGSSVFISYLTTHANEVAFSKKRKTIMPADVFEALKLIEFERFVADLKQTFEQTEADNKAKRERNKSMKDAPTSQAQEADTEADGDALPPSKRTRVENGDDTEMHEGGEAGEEENDEQEDADDDEDDEEEEDDDDDEADEEDEVEGEIDAADETTAANQLEDAVQEPDTVQEDDYDEVLDNGEDSD
ncbi:putative CBF/NF-Y family transcription factor [Taphrina deformans PYCC 5710]|uniref:DNA polymerase epsilon subunit D n=1 Tax=Taphrina deformans (strain PYCC 5710 / ATCC 11124 / CBS 356.35 / IMI 108563 / JCM 9778 / NBRC 8474) TaxID=1097556 RepID=R4X7Y5_TAPDE|nr:putative CBF/NF-Y family transcription factor [Taphrina deformans PYCC 5710]|eukprot:CCG81575.1 putative CBF/NF-Y family transcription factor [Taphrina deformans PYCC 5710]